MENTEDHIADWISSVEVTNITGISRATLNNYIKYGLLPKPEIRKPQTEGAKAVKIGYFPRTVLDILLRIREMKKEGYSMKDIVNLMNKGEAPVNSGLVDGSIQAVKDVCEESGTGKYIQSSNVALTMNDIKCPAYLLNSNFEIDWINDEGEEKLFNRQIRYIKESNSRNIFKLFIEMGYLNGNENKNNLLIFHMSLYKCKYQKVHIKKLFQGITPREIEKFEKLYDGASAICKDSVNQAYVAFRKPNQEETTAYHVYFMTFREGTLILYEKIDSLMQGISEILTNRSWVINDLLQQRLPTLTSFSVLVADLQDSIRICAELPPEEYFELVNSIWKCMECSFKKYYGTYGKHSGDGMVYYFLKDRDTNYLMNAVMCALEVRENMKSLNAEWKLRKGWYNELYLNIGINEGQEYFGTIPASTNIEFTALGDTVNIAGRLSDFADHGSIWTTKNLMNRFTQEERKTLRFGIKKHDFDREVFVENMFSRIIDMMPDIEQKINRKYMDIATIPVTEIIDAMRS
jgi:class 3 adenylate cyclase/DNA-binding transcriptional MerR regulator